MLGERVGEGSGKGLTGGKGMGGGWREVLGGGGGGFRGREQVSGVRCVWIVGRLDEWRRSGMFEGEVMESL